jgi:hypothetical protein
MTVKSSPRYFWLQVVGADVMGEANVSAEPPMDMWSLGVIAFELLTDRGFYPAGTPAVHRQYSCTPCPVLVKSS